MGYHRAGFEVTGVDINPQTRYPFTFIQGDAIEYLANHGHEYDVIHASPPCQLYSRGTAAHRKNGKVYKDMIPVTRQLLEEIGKPYIIENVPHSPIRADIKLCGWNFGLKHIIRERWFEVGGGLFIMCPYPTQVPKGIVKHGKAVSIFGKGSYKQKGNKHPEFDQGSVEKTWQYAMGIDWMNCDGLREAIPPAYTEYIGTEILNQLKL
jgi:DNA (cytosine-5)-methyltransferase 1